MTEWAYWISNSAWFTLSGGIASIASLAISVYVASRVRAIQRETYFRHRVPDLLKDLRRTSTELAKFLNDFESNRRDVRELLIKTRPAVENLGSKFSGEMRRKAKVLLTELDSYLGTRHLLFRKTWNANPQETVDRCRAVYEMLLDLDETAKHQMADYRERIRHGG